MLSDNTLDMNMDRNVHYRAPFIKSVHLNFILPYHEREFKVITVKGTFFHGQCQSMEDGDKYLKITKDIFYIFYIKDYYIKTAKRLISLRA